MNHVILEFLTIQQAAKRNKKRAYDMAFNHCKRKLVTIQSSTGVNTFDEFVNALKEDQNKDFLKVKKK